MKQTKIETGYSAQLHYSAQLLRRLLAHSGHPYRATGCLLLGVKRTSRLIEAMSAFDPKRTLSSGAVERDPRHNSILLRGSTDLFSLTFLQGPQVPCSAPSVILGRILRRE